MNTLPVQQAINQRASSLFARIQAETPSTDFWLCHIVGWLSYALLDSLQMHFHTGNFFIRWTTQLLLITSGTLLCLLYRAAYRRNHWHQSHPLSHLPLAVLIALLL